MKNQPIHIAIFENEFHLIKDDFEIANYTFFEENLNYEVFESSQKFSKDLSKIHEYDISFIDVDLSKASEWDGLTLMSKLISSGYPKEKMIILTGHSSIKDKIKDRELPTIDILRKPIDIEDLQAAIVKVLRYKSK